jgi:integrase
MLVLLTTFCTLRWGEMAALTRSAVDPDGGWLTVRATLSEMGDGSLVIGPPKTAAGRRVVAIPAALLPALRQHLADYVGEDAEALVFAGPKAGPPRRSNFQDHWSRALVAAGVPSSVHIHDLRHTGNTLAAQSGATLSDLMARMGHASTRAARIYLHTTSQRDREVAAALNAMLSQPPTGTQRARHTSRRLDRLRRREGNGPLTCDFLLERVTGSVARAGVRSSRRRGAPPDSRHSQTRF